MKKNNTEGYRIGHYRSRANVQEVESREVTDSTEG